ncbi:MAG: hypothetical protein E7521_08605 [Ruminococcaceae bacterium]|nr:hypothetical protein [Oscillospiraceae bacterium]
MKKYYIIREDGSSIFEQAYPEDFVFHCLIHLLDRTSEETYRLCEIDSNVLKSLSLSAENNFSKDLSCSQSGWLCWRSE